MFFKRIKSWSIEKKRFFSISCAIFLTIIIIILNAKVNTVWKKDNIKNNSVDNIQNSVLEIVNQAKPLFDQAMSSTTEIIDQSKGTSSTSTATTSIVE